MIMKPPEPKPYVPNPTQIVIHSPRLPLTTRKPR